MKHKILNAMTLIAITVAMLSPLALHAANGFDPSYIISDAEMVDYNSMSLQRIQRFLERQPGTLAAYMAIDADDETIKPASEIIYKAAQQNRINPKYLIALLQKEQSLIEDPYPSQRQYDWATGYGVCDSCSTDESSIQRFKGFYKQVDGAAWQTRRYMERPGSYTFEAGKTYAIDDQQVTIKNGATASLYNYTPHIHGNYNLWRIYDDYFRILYPNGSVVQVEGEPGVWLIQGGLRRAFMNMTALVTRYDMNQVLLIEKAELEKYPVGMPLRYPEYALLRSPQGTIYLLADDTKRRIVSMEVFRIIGFNMEEVMNVGQAEADEIPDGIPVTMESSYPAGALLQDSATGGVFFVMNGAKSPIWSKEILKANFPSLKIAAVDPAELEAFPTMDPVKFKDGTLATSEVDSAVYVISNGLKRPIASGEIFEEYGYKWDNIISTTEAALKIHPTGAMIE